MIPLLFLSCVYVPLAGAANAPDMIQHSSQFTVAERTQRDVSKPVPIDQLVTPGISLNSLVYNTNGYVKLTLDVVVSHLSSGVQTFMLDLYWNEFTHIWQLCPAPFPSNVTNSLDDVVDLYWNGQQYRCEVGLTVDQLMNSIASFISSTHTNLEVNLLELLINLKTILATTSNKTSVTTSTYTSSNPAFNALGNSTLANTFASLGSYVFSPSDLATYRTSQMQNQEYSSFYNQSTNSLPLLDTVLFSYFKRIFINIVTVDLHSSANSYSFSSADNSTVFFLSMDLASTIVSNSNSEVLSNCDEINTSPVFNITTFDKLSLATHFRYVIDEDGYPFTNDTYSQYLRCGYSPILNATQYQIPNLNNVLTSNILAIADTFMPISFWSWAKGEPRAPSSYNLNSTNSNYTLAESDSNYDSSADGSQVAYQCVAVNENGWTVQNCYRALHYACQNDESPNDWIIPKEKKQYFEAYKDLTCPEGYRFSLPSLSVEMMSLQNSIRIQEAIYPVWIDLNDITVSNCFVSGGPYAECPYQRTVSEAGLAGLIAPSFVVAVVVLFLVFLEKIFRVNPIQTNRRRYWKRVIVEYNKKHDYEGVPS